MHTALYLLVISHALPYLIFEAGFHLDAPVFSALFNSFDVSRKRQIGLPEYIAMTLFLQSATATFRAFDPQQQGHITLTFDQVGDLFVMIWIHYGPCIRFYFQLKKGLHVNKTSHLVAK